MEFGNLVAQFLDYQQLKYSLTERTIQRYRYILGVYSNYLSDRLKITNETMSPFLKGVNENHLFDALDYYVSEKFIESEDTARLFISVLKELYCYLHTEKSIHNNRLIESFGLPTKNTISFSSKVNSKMKELKSKKILKYSGDSPIAEEQFLKVLEYCNTVLEEEDYTINYKNCLCAVIVKLILFIGLSMREIYKIKCGDIDLEHSTITINGFIVHLPYQLYDQIKKYVKCSDKIVHREEQSLFINQDGSKVNNNSDVGNFIGKSINSFSTISLGKYTITEMIRNGINQSIIQSLTGYGINVYEPCQEMINIEKDNNRSRYLDSKLRGMPLFDLL